MNEPIATDEAEDDIAYSVTHNPDVVASTDDGSLANLAPDIPAQDTPPPSDVVEHADDPVEEAEGEAVDMVALDETLEYIRPALQADGGDLILLGVKGGTVNLQLVGACGGCPMSTMTLKQGIERIIFDRVPGATEVIAV